ncbi:MAG: acyl-CoA thioesterase [Cuniculiplasma sp.]
MEFVQRTKIQMRYGDLDALGHVNNAVFLTYYELGRTNYVRDFLGGFVSTDVKFVVNHAEVDFRSPIHFEDSPEILTWISKVGNTSCIFSHEIKSETDGKLFSSGKTVIVWIDNNFKKVPIEHEIRKKLQTLLIKDD